MCVEELSDTEHKHLTKLTLLPEFEPRCNAGKQWQEWERFMRNALTAHRATQQKVDAKQWLKEELNVFPGDGKTIDEMLNNSNPAVREFSFDELRWKRLEDCAATCNFDFNVLVIYKLKLLLVEKWANASQQKGIETLDNLMDSLLAQAKEKRTMSNV